MFNDTKIEQIFDEKEAEILILSANSMNPPPLPMRIIQEPSTDKTSEK